MKQAISVSGVRSGLSGRGFSFQVKAGFGLLLMLGLIGGVGSIVTAVTMGRALDVAANQTSKKLEMIGEIQGASEALRAGQRGVILYSLVKDRARATGAERQFEEAARRIEERMEDLRPLLVRERGRAAVKRMGEALAAWRGIFPAVVAASGRGEYGGELSGLVDRSFGIAGEIDGAAGELVAVQRELLGAASAEAETLTFWAKWGNGGLMGLSLLLGGVVLMVVRRATARMEGIARQLAEGADQVAGAAATVAETSQRLAQGTGEQAAAIEETSASTEEILSMAARNADNAAEGMQRMGRMAKEVGQAKGALEKMRVSMGEINASSDRIAQIIRVIDEIAFQTNILALNAAVEAARAGEAGLGFAVVAEEVRNLAQRSAQAAKDTAALIEESVSRSRQGRERVDEVAEATLAIDEGAAAVATLVDEVGAGSAEQTRGLDQIRRAVTEMQAVTQQNAASSEEGAAASEELAAQASSLHDLAGTLQVLVAGGAGQERRGSW